MMYKTIHNRMTTRKIQGRKRCALILALAAGSILSPMGLISCVNQDKPPEAKTIKDLHRAIDAIEDRRDAEFRIVQEQNREIGILRQNLERVNSDGMREKIREDIEMRQSAKWKAEKNIANQDTILSRLYGKRDSLTGEHR